MRNRKINKTIPDDLLMKLKIFGGDIAAARKVRRISQDDFAKSLNVSRATISRIEAGDHTVGFGAILASAWVMGLEDNIFSAFAPENDPVMQREARLSLPKRIGSPRTSSTEENGITDTSMDF